MKLKTENLFTFVRNNHQHFESLDERLKNLLEFAKNSFCTPCSQNNKNSANYLSEFKKILQNDKIRLLILDKSKDLLDDVVELEDFSVNNYSENDQNK